MNIKGFDALSKHVPELQTTIGLVRAILAFVAVCVATTIFFLAADHNFSEWMPDGEVVVMALGFLVMSRFFSQKKIYQQKYGEMAFRNAFARFTLPGLGIIFASIAHLGYISGPQVPLLWWTKVLIALGWVLVAVGVVLWIRSVTVLGADYLTMLYVYYPKESRIVNSSIYSVLRHPIYAAALYVGIGLALIHANWYALLVALILPLFLTGWVRLVEEKELLERFPDYADYRKHVPAFWARPRDLAKFYSFLLFARGG